MVREAIQVLIVDDVQAIRTQVKQLLRASGFKNLTVSENGAEAQKILAENTFDLIICDWQMTPVDGMGLLKFVREHPLHYEIPFIMLTAEDTREKVVEAIAHGIDDYLIKPLTIEKLNTRVDGLLRRKKVLT